MLRVVVREDFTKSRCDALIADFKLALQTLDALDAKKIEDQKQYVLCKSSQEAILTLFLDTHLPCAAAQHLLAPSSRRTRLTISMKSTVYRQRQERHMLSAELDLDHLAVY